jgi:hypothetical protein
MAFCTSCGSTVDGAFCIKCGARVSAAGAPAIPPPPAQPTSSPVVTPAAPAQAPKKGRFIFWILGGCLGLIAIAAILFFVAGSYIFHRVGFDRGLLEKKPELAVVKMMVSANPDLEILSIDEGRGIIQVREKKSGKTLTVNIEDAKNGKISFMDDQNKKVEIRTQGEGDNASVEIQSDQGSMRMGSKAAVLLPNWLPSYPGAIAAGGMALNEEDGNSGSCSLKTNDSVQAVAKFYENALKNAGFEVQSNAMQASGQGSMITLSASDINTQRKADVTMVHSEEGTVITLTFGNK